MVKKNYFRPAVAALEGYAPGEQPKIDNLVKLNTNENPYPPSPEVGKALAACQSDKLRLYPDPTADALRDAVARRCGAKRENVIAGNGSDDLLTMIFRSFTDKEHPVACLWPTYSLYPVLAAMQEAKVLKIELGNDDFALPSDALKRAAGANLLIVTRPNAPTGNSFPKKQMRELCEGFDGVVVFDEAYADFADDNCLDLALEFDHVLVMRTFSKSYSLAGLRLGYAVGDAALIEGLMKLKDSYNVDRLAQELGLAAYLDTAYHEKRCAEVKDARTRLAGALRELGFTVIPSQTNFLFAAPPERNGRKYFEFLRSEAVLVRYFKGERTGEFVRITIGDETGNRRLLEATRKFLQQGAR